MIIFLDMDGVLCTGRVAIATGEVGVISGLDPVGMTFLNRICREYNVKTVISSTWRVGKDKRSFYEIFACSGYVDLAASIVHDWKTPIVPDGSRGDEIAQWLSMNAYEGGYIIIDDDDDMLPEQLTHFVQTDCLNGMTMENFEEIENMIKAEASQ